MLRVVLRHNALGQMRYWWVVKQNGIGTKEVNEKNVEKNLQMTCQNFWHILLYNIGKTSTHTNIL